MPSALILYQYFHPDDVVSAVHLSDLAEGLVNRGWQVTAMPCNRSCRTKETYPKLSSHAGVGIKRIWRPSFPQNRAAGRIANCLWMLLAWSLKALTTCPDVLVIGTDPILSAAVTIPWKLLRPSTRIVHLCFDLYPEAAVADGMLTSGLLLKLLRQLMALSYRQVDLLADIGDCMRQRLSAYPTAATQSRFWPWALVEPADQLEPDPRQRKSLFGAAKLAISYSGSFGRAHSFTELLVIARHMRSVHAHFSFSVRGNRVAEIENALTRDDHNISFAPFAPPHQLEARLSAADIHVVSLRQEWTGIVVPSKFFGALAAGRPVLFIGSEDCSIAKIIRRYSLGWVCAPGAESTVANQLKEFISNTDLLRGLQERCRQTYRMYFAREIVLDGFESDLRSLLSAVKPSEADLVEIQSRSQAAGKL